MKVLSLGFDSYIPQEQVVCILRFDTPASIRLRTYYKKKYVEDLDIKLINLTKGRKAQACILTTNGQLFITIRSYKNLIRQLTGDYSLNRAESETL